MRVNNINRMRQLRRDLKNKPVVKKKKREKKSKPQVEELEPIVVEEIEKPKSE